MRYVFLKIIAAVLFICICFKASSQKKVEVNSPDKNIAVLFEMKNNKLLYNITYKNKPIIQNSSLDLVFDDGNYFTSDLEMHKPEYKDSTEDYDLVTGKTSHVHDRFKEVIIPFEQKKSTYKKINIEAKIFNDGVAFRYVFPQQQNWNSFTLTDENSSFNFTGNPVMHALLFPNYTSSHEGYYNAVSLKDLRPDTLIDLPALFEMPNHVYVAVTEAALLDYAGMYLSKHNDTLISKLSPWPNQTTIKVKAIVPHVSPWRVFLISDRIGALVESNIITSLNAPCAIKDVSWLKPGKTTFPWWNGNVTPDTLNAPGNNFVTAQYYIDFCARNNIQYHSVVEYGLHQWYVDDGVGFQPGPHADVTTPVPGLDMKAICDYAATKNVGIRVWVHFYALYPKLDTAFAVFEKWGLKGMMVDFMDRDDQLMVNMQTEILQKAAAHHLHIQFHGAYKPTGLNRTYPNEFTREGTLNYEVDKWSNSGVSPDHDINMPFTRVLAGSTDYHLGGFRAVPQSEFRAQYTRPLVLGTRCHMLAMYVVLENYLQMVCDYPAAYEGQPGFEFIKEVPTTWDETKVLNAELDKYITTARRKNNDWYVGTITNHEARDITIPFNFLADGKYTLELYRDADDVNINPNHLTKQIKTVSNKNSITIHIAPGGGEVMRLIKQ